MQVWVYRCIQELMFLQPRISRHPFYAQAKAALQADPSRPLLVPPSMALCNPNSQHIASCCSTVIRTESSQLPDI